MEAQLKVRLAGSGTQFPGPALAFRMNQMDRNDCLLRYCEEGNQSIKGICIPVSPNVNRKRETGSNTHTHTVCEAVALMK